MKELVDLLQILFCKTRDPTAPHNAVKVGEYNNIPEGIGNTMNLSVNQNAVLDQFIQAGTFQTFMTMTFDKAFSK